MMLKDSHTSVIGMRNVARCDQIIILPKIELLEKFLNENLNTKFNFDQNNLFILTAMSNFCGRKYNLNVIKKIRKGKSFFFVEKL